MRNSLLLVQIDGIELMTELLQNEGWSHIPIIGKQITSNY
jgi:CheY-like chemotaxis protein